MGYDVREIALAELDGKHLYHYSVIHDRPDVHLNFLRALLGSGSMEGALSYDFSQAISKINSSIDIGLAILSRSHTALKNLIRNYEIVGKEVEINTASESLAAPSTEGFRSTAARNLRPLDFAVQLYVQQRMWEDVWEGSGNLHDDLEILGSKSTEKKIELLLTLGALGSEMAYFPVANSSLLAPFTDTGGFEIMSLKEFCRSNQCVIPSHICFAIASIGNKEPAAISRKIS